MNNIVRTGFLAAAVAARAAVAAPEAPAPEALEEGVGGGRWRVSAGVRFAPGVKVSARATPGGSVFDELRRRAAAGASGGDSAPRETWTTSETKATQSSESHAESVEVPAGARLEFDNGFVDMTDDAGIPGQTVNWHFADASAFSESAGSVTAVSRTTSVSEGEPQTRTSSEAASFSSRRVDSAESIAADLRAGGEKDVPGGDFEAAYSFYREGRLSLGIAVGATLYRNVDAIRLSGRCGAVATTASEDTASGTVETTTSAYSRTTTETTEETAFTDPSFAYAGAAADIVNDDGSIGAGTPDGYTNPHGGPNPVLSVGSGSVTKTTTVDSRTETTRENRHKWTPSSSSSRTSKAVHAVDLEASGDVDMIELRAALQPSWQMTDRIALRGAFGLAATRVGVDVDSAIKIDGSAWRKYSGDDSKVVLSALCGLDADLALSELFVLTAGCDMRLGGRSFDYEAGPVSGRIELARYTLRLGVQAAW